MQRVEPDPDKGGNYLLEQMDRYEAVGFLSGLRQAMKPSPRGGSVSIQMNKQSR